MEKRLNICIAIILFIYFCITALSITHKTITYDEGRHYNYGLKILHLNSDRGDEDSKMPFSAFNAIPLSFSIFTDRIPLVAAISPYLKTLSAARIVTIFFALILAGYIYRWSSSLYGKPAGVFSLLLFVLSPNLIAHARLITTDLFAALMLTVACYHYWIFLNNIQLKNGLASAATLGISQLAKYTAAYLYLLFIILLCITKLPQVKEAVQAKQGKTIVKQAKRLGGYLMLFVIINLSIINIGFLFNGTFTPLKDYKCYSKMFNTLKNTPVIRSIPLPFPKPFIQGMDRVKFYDRTGLSYGNIYLNGELRGNKGLNFSGFKGYFFYCMLYKMPIAVMIFILLSIIRYFRSNAHHRWLAHEIYLFVPILFFTIYYNFFFNTDIGIRFITVIFPMLYIFCGSLIKDWYNLSTKTKMIFGGLFVYLAVSVASYFPHYLSYFNEFTWDRKQAYKLLANSNLDWGQNRWYLKRYKQTHPNIIFEPTVPTSGKIVVSINNLVGVTEPERYRWLRENFEPIGHIAYSYLIFDVPQSALSQKLR